MIEERERGRSAASVASQSDRRARVNCRRIDVHAVETTLSDHPAQPRPIFRRGMLAFGAQRPLAGGGQVSAGSDEECTAAHRRDREREATGSRQCPPLDERMQRAPDQILRQRSRRIKRSGGLAPACGDGPEDGLVNRSELLDAEITVRNAPASAGGRLGGQRERTVAIVSSGTRAVSASGACDGSNRRPLNGVTISSPARQPACASLDAAWSAAQRPWRRPRSARSASVPME